ncbi:MAG TPA: TIGR02186 family protein [Gammaproteobacteria bacterium]|nr:TIGR02186 family protein [Gammaproteobacteria bacterium]
MRKLWTSLLLALAVAFAPAAGAALVTDLSDTHIKVSYHYQGENLLVFGSLPEKGGHVIVEVRGPEKSRTIQRKGKVMGFLWMNVEDLTVKDFPGYYALLSDAPIESFLTPEERNRLDVGHDALFNSAEYHGETAKAGPRDYFDGLLKYMGDHGLYQEKPNAVTIKRGALFRAELRMPSRAPVGDYQVVVRQWKDGQVIHRDTQGLSVAKTGIEKWLYDMAFEHPAWYGLMAVLVALFAGWFVGIITRGEAEH